MLSDKVSEHKLNISGGCSQKPCEHNPKSDPEKCRVMSVDTLDSNGGGSRSHATNNQDSNPKWCQMMMFRIRYPCWRLTGTI